MTKWSKAQSKFFRQQSESWISFHLSINPYIYAFIGFGHILKYVYTISTVTIFAMRMMWKLKRSQRVLQYKAITATSILHTASFVCIKVEHMLGKINVL